MLPTNFYMFFVTAFIPMVVGFIWYHDSTFGKSWKNVNGFTDEYLGKANMGVVMGTAYFLSVLLSLFMSSLVIHQGGVFALLMPEIMEAGTTEQNLYKELMVNYGDRFRTFSHGALHGAITTIFGVLPLIAINALFERRGWKYIFIHVGYWLVTLTLIGGVICATLKYAPLT